VPATDAAKPRRASDRLAFLKGLAGNPRLTGAVAPSGPALSRLMASFVDPDDDKPILELGPGTGVVTAALIERGIARGELIPVDADALAHVLIGACAEATLHVLATGQADGAVQVVHRFIDGLATPRRGSGAAHLPQETQAPLARPRTTRRRAKPPSRRKPGRQDR